MDVKKVESVAVPTALATVGAGLAGYMAPKMLNNGQLSDEFLYFASTTMAAKDQAKIYAADSLDRITKLPTGEELIAVSKKKDPVKALKKLLDKKASNADKTLEKFVVKHAEELDIKPAKGQSIKEAAREYIKGRSIEEIKETFLPAPMRRAMQETNYKKILKECFEEVYDGATKAFKAGEGVDEEMVKMFKRAAKEMKISVGCTWGAVAGGIALVSSLIANRINKK